MTHLEGFYILGIFNYLPKTHILHINLHNTLF